MGQLAGRLKELARLYGQDERAWQSDLDAVADLERHDQQKAHARFVALRDTFRDRRYRDVQARLRAIPWLHDVPDEPVDVLTAKEKDRAIRAFEAALKAAGEVEAAVAEARAWRAEIRSRRVDAVEDAFARVAFPDLEQAAADAEAARRRVAREARVDARARALGRRAGKIGAVPVTVPDVSSDAVPDAGDAHARLDEAEARVKRAERVDAAHARVTRALRDPAVREHRRAEGRRVRDAAAVALGADDLDAAAARLEALADEAEALRRDAAAAATRVAKARKRGLARPGRREPDDPPGYA